MENLIQSKKSVFNPEGGSWRSLKKAAAYRYNYDERSAQTIAELPQREPGTTILEKGAGEGGRLSLFKKIFEFCCGGIEPSERVVEHIKPLGVNIVRGTADELRFSDNLFKTVISVFVCICATDQMFLVCC